MSKSSLSLCQNQNTRTNWTSFSLISGKNDGQKWIELHEIVLQTIYSSLLPLEIGSSIENSPPWNSILVHTLSELQY